RLMFHTLSIPRFSWIWIECRKAVADSQGSSDAFSTGSQNHHPPQPSSSYAQRIPNTIPFERKNQESRIHRRVRAIQRESSRPESSAAIANANGIVNAVKPR